MTHICSNRVGCVGVMMIIIIIQIVESLFILYSYIFLKVFLSEVWHTMLAVINTQQMKSELCICLHTLVCVCSVCLVNSPYSFVRGTIIISRFTAKSPHSGSFPVYNDGFSPLSMNPNGTQAVSSQYYPRLQPSTYSETNTFLRFKH